jgi:hypothetical protein
MPPKQPRNHSRMGERLKEHNGIKGHVSQLSSNRGAKERRQCRKEIHTKTSESSVSYRVKILTIKEENRGGNMNR